MAEPTQKTTITLTATVTIHGREVSVETVVEESTDLHRLPLLLAQATVAEEKRLALALSNAGILYAPPEAGATGPGGDWERG